MRVEVSGTALLHGRLALAAALVAACAAAGCANPFSPEGDDVGVYKGEQDPLTEKSTADRQEALRERFEVIQSR